MLAPFSSRRIAICSKTVIIWFFVKNGGSDLLEAGRPQPPTLTMLHPEGDYISFCGIQLRKVSECRPVGVVCGCTERNGNDLGKSMRDCCNTVDEYRHTC